MIIILFQCRMFAQRAISFSNITFLALGFVKHKTIKISSMVPLTMARSLTGNQSRGLMINVVF